MKVANVLDIISGKRSTLGPKAVWRKWIVYFNGFSVKSFLQLDFVILRTIFSNLLLSGGPELAYRSLSACTENMIKLIFEALKLISIIWFVTTIKLSVLVSRLRYTKGVILTLIIHKDKSENNLRCNLISNTALFIPKKIFYGNLINRLHYFSIEARQIAIPLELTANTL